jgi:methylglutaconyl-CoA hydratase
MAKEGSIKINKLGKKAELIFSHPKGNSLPGYLLKDLTSAINDLASDENIDLIILMSEGDKAFCGGASFDELVAIKDLESGKKFFMGFADLIIAVRNCPKFIVAKVQGRVVGGGAGLVAAADYAIASVNASIRLSELALGIGPFVIGPVLERKMGRAGFMSMTINHNWKDARWAHARGLYDEICERDQLNERVDKFADTLLDTNPEAVKELKKIFWDGTDNLEELLEERAEISGRLVLSEYTAKFINNFKDNRSES